MLVNPFEKMASDETVQNLLLVMMGILEKMPRIDANHRVLANLETGTGASVGLNSGQTLATVTTVGTVSAVTNLGTNTANGVPFHMSNMGAAHIYNNIVVQ